MFVVCWLVVALAGCGTCNFEFAGGWYNIGFPGFRAGALLVCLAFGFCGGFAGVCCFDGLLVGILVCVIGVASGRGDLCCSGLLVQVWVLIFCFVALGAFCLGLLDC